MRILVTGANGQLGQCLYSELKENYYYDEYVFTNKNSFDITDINSMERFYEEDSGLGFEFLINCAAYTNVEGAEDDIVSAFTINSRAIKNLTDFCKKHNICLIHISTDYVYDSIGICDENSTINPLSIYAQSKRDGELIFLNSGIEGYIFRTSWLFSEYAGNFVSNLLNKIQNNKYEQLSGVVDEIGSPTYARDLARFILSFIEQGWNEYLEPGIYNFSNQGYSSRYNFMKKIFEGYINLPIFKDDYNNYIMPPLSYDFDTKILLNIEKITQEESYKKFNIKAPRPTNIIMNNSKLCNSKIETYFDFRRWETAIGECLDRYNEIYK